MSTVPETPRDAVADEAPAVGAKEAEVERPARPERKERTPERRCLVTGEIGEATTLIRFVVDPAGRIVPDLAGRLPGRGYWVTATRAMVDEAVRRHLFIKAVARANKGGGISGNPIVADKWLGQLVADLLTRSCLDLLGLARRAGLVITGFEKVREALAANPGAVLVTAVDGSEDGRSKLAKPDRQLVVVFSREELSLALGRGNVVHAALTPEGVGVRFLEEVERLKGFRDLEDPARTESEAACG